MTSAPLRLGEFRIERNPDPGIAEALEVEAGWLRGGGEVERRFRVDPSAHWVARTADGGVVGGAGCFVFREGGLGWVGGMVVRPSARRRGLARALLRVSTEDAAARGATIIGLDATDLGRPLYVSEGYRLATISTRWARPEGRARPDPGPRGPYSIYPFSACEVLEVHAYDAQRFGANRARWIAEVVADLPDRAFVALDRRTGVVAGFALGQEAFIGPVVADAPEAAAWLVYACEQAGSPARAHLLGNNPAAERAFSAAGYAPEPARTARMTKGGPLPGRAETLFAAAAWALG